MKTTKLGAINFGVLLLVGGVCLLLLPNSKPAKWLRGRDARAVDAAQAQVSSASAKVDDKRGDVVHGAHIESLKTELALHSAPDSRPVEVARRTSANTNAMLGQVDTVTVAEMQELMALVRGLLSAEADKLKQAEAKQQAAEAGYAKLGAELAKLTADLDAAHVKLDSKERDLRAAYDREAALADRYRAIRSILIGVAVLAIAGFALMVWFRLRFMGLRAGLARSIADADFAGIGSQVRSVLDPRLNRDEQDKLKALATTELAKLLAERHNKT